LQQPVDVVRPTEVSRTDATSQLPYGRSVSGTRPSKFADFQLLRGFCATSWATGLYEADVGYSTKEQACSDIVA